MKVLLDTHPLIWSLRNDPSLSSEARRVISNVQDNLIYISVVSIWEMRIKQSIGKLKDIPDNYYDMIKELPVEILTITGDHAYAVGDLPHYHRDPFDRLLIAQARLENLTLVTRDPEIQKYDVSILLA